MTGGVDQVHLALSLVEYADGVAMFAAPELPMMSGADSSVVLHLRREEWSRLGRPEVLDVSVRWSVPS